jgi:hypothetical protein
VIQKDYAIEGVLSQPSFVTTISPLISTLQSKHSSSRGSLVPSHDTNGFWGTIYEQEPSNDTKFYNEEFLFPPERVKIVEENLLYEIQVILQVAKTTISKSRGLY